MPCYLMLYLQGELNGFLLHSLVLPMSFFTRLETYIAYCALEALRHLTRSPPFLKNLTDWALWFSQQGWFLTNAAIFVSFSLFFQKDQTKKFICLCSPHWHKEGPSSAGKAHIRISHNFNRDSTREGKVAVLHTTAAIFLQWQLHAAYC